MNELTIKYIPITQARLWDRNPKNHDFGAIIESIMIYGFQDPPKYDSSLGALVEGNGRTEALWMMMNDGGYTRPKGILLDKETGHWSIPIIFGNDLASESIAIKYAIDHNNLSMMGGDGLTAKDMAKLWDEKAYIELLMEVGGPTVSVDDDDLALLMMDTTSVIFSEADLDDFSIPGYRVIIDGLPLEDAEKIVSQFGGKIVKRKIK